MAAKLAERLVQSRIDTLITGTVFPGQIFEKYPGRVMVCKEETCVEQMPDEPIDLELTI